MPANRTAGVELRGGAGTLRGRIYWPSSSVAGPAPLLVFLTAADDGTWCQELSAGAGLVVLSVTCGRPHPADLHDAVAATGWAAGNTGRLGADPGHLRPGGPARGARSPPRSRCMLGPTGPRNDKKQEKGDRQ